ncbi:MAG: PAS domain S-box protein [Candidatus Sabulitectum sp.]|nr:PAS domain S-box protein [Candidatus Sabulitectum sp.]
MNKRFGSYELNLFQQMNDGIVLLNGDFIIEYANPSFLSLVQASSLEEISVFEFHEFAATEQDKILLRELQSSSLMEVSLSTRTMNRKVIPVELSVSPRVDLQGIILGYTVAVRNISLRRNDRDRLQQTMEKYRDIAFCDFDWLWEIDSAGTYTYASASVRECMGYSPEELFGQTPFDFMSREEGMRIASIFNRIASRNESFNNLENRCITKSGDEIVVATSGVPVFDEGGKLKGYRGGDRDITEQVRIAGELKNSQGAAQKMLESLPVGVVIIDSSKRIRQINDRACLVIGREMNELIGEMCHSAICPSLVDQCPILDLEKKIDRAEHFVLHKDGRKIPVVKSAIPVRINSEDLLLEVFIDVSEIKSLEKELNEKNRELRQEIESLKQNVETKHTRNQKNRKHRKKHLSDKIAALGGITGMVDMLLEAEQAEEQRSMLIAVQAECMKLTDAVHLLQDKMDDFQGGFSRECHEFLIRKLLRLVAAPLRDRCISIDVQVDPLLPDLFYGPVRGIESVLRVLLDYSLSLLSNDAIEIGVTYLSSNEQTMEIRFSVNISGAEFFPESVSQFFADEDSPAFDRRMTACREFAQASGGELHGRDDSGSDFAFWLTIPLEQRIDQGLMEKITLDGTHVLVMENDRQLQSVYLKMLESSGCRCTAVADRTAALMKLREAAECGDPVQIAILDGDCSGKDGLVTARLIRHDSVIASRTNMVICSSQIKTGDVDAYKAEGCSALLRKPVSLSTLRNCLIKLVGRSGEDLPIITEYSLP